jgi:hypothetical protein
MTATCPVHLIHVDFTTLIVLMKNVNYEAPHYTIKELTTNAG